MLLTIDVGNTHTVLGLFDGEEIVEHWRISTDARRTADELAVLLQGLMGMHPLLGEELGDGIDGIAIRLVVKTAPLEQWVVARELRRRIKTAFDAAGIEIPFPQRSLWLRTDPAEAPAVVPPDAQEASARDE